jgi:hypothetical protein
MKKTACMIGCTPSRLFRAPHPTSSWVFNVEFWLPSWFCASPFGPYQSLGHNQYIHGFLTDENTHFPSYWIQALWATSLSFSRSSTLIQRLHCHKDQPRHFHIWRRKWIGNSVMLCFIGLKVCVFYSCLLLTLAIFSRGVRSRSLSTLNKRHPAYLNHAQHDM